MKIKKKIINLLLIFFSILVLEIFSSSVVYYKEKKIGLIFRPLNPIINKQEIFSVHWDNKTNKIVPGSYEAIIHGKKINYTINSKGFRNKEFNTNKGNHKRIISLGGSTTMGLGSSDDKTYPAQLESILKNKNYNFEVLNFGFSGKSLNFIRDLFFQEVTNYNPDFITIYSNRNPIMYDSIGTKVSIDKQSKNIFFKKVNLFLMNNIMTFRLLFKVYRKIISLSISSEKIISPYDDNIEHNIYYFTNQHIDSLKEIISYCEKKSIKVILIKQAFLIDVNVQKKMKEKTLEELIIILKNLRKKNFYNLNYHDSFWIVTSTILNKNLDKLKNLKNVTVVDPVNQLINNNNNFSDMVHLTPEGNLVLAQEIYSGIKNNLK